MPVAKPMAAFIGLLTAWPPIYFVGVMAALVGAGGDPALMTDTATFDLMFRLHLLTMLVTFGLMAYFVVHLFNNDRLSPDRRLLWLVVLFLGNMFAFPVYWLLYVWRAPRAS